MRVLLLCWLILIIFIILYLIQIEEKSLKEHFQWDPLWVGKTSSNCYEESNKDCLKYSNCGLCSNGSQKQCIPGDVDGAFFKEGCQRWEYANYYDRNIERVRKQKLERYHVIREFEIFRRILL